MAESQNRGAVEKYRNVQENVYCSFEKRKTRLTEPANLLTMDKVLGLLLAIDEKYVAGDYVGICGHLSSLGDLLRDPEIRSSREVTGYINSLIAITNGAFDHLKAEPSSKAAHEAYRVLVNLTADNDANRSCLASLHTANEKVFWNNTKLALQMAHLEELAESRILVFLSQFIHNSEQLKEYTGFFQSIHLETSICHYIKAQTQVDADVDEVFDLLINPLEILAEMAAETSSESLSKSFSLQDVNVLMEAFDTLAGLLSSASDEELAETINEVFTYLSSVLYSTTSVDDIPQIHEVRPTEKLLGVLQKLGSTPICQNLKDITLIRRRVFSSLGNISSMTTYNNDVDVVTNIETILHAVDAYSSSAAAIGLGNSINSRGSQKICLHKIKEQYSLADFISSFFKVPFQDVVQYQAFHLLTNLLDDEVACAILHNKAATERIQQYTKVVIDNSRYYKEVASIYTKFAKKLVRVGFVEGNEDMFKYTDIWQAFNNIEQELELSVSIELEEINLVLLQALLAHEHQAADQNVSFSKSLLQAAVSDANLNTNVSVRFVLEKIKSIGMLLSLFNQRLVDSTQILTGIYAGDKTDYDMNFLQPLARVLEKLNETVTASGEAEGPGQRAQYDALVNNAKFVAASAVPFAKNDALVEDRAKKLLEGLL